MIINKQYVKDDTYVFATGQRLDIPSEPVTRHDGAVLLFQTVKFPIFDLGGKVVQTAGISRDITSQNQATEALRASEEYYRGLFNELPIGLALCRMDGSLVDVNPAYADVIGRTIAAKLLGYYATEVCVPGRGAGAQPADNRALRPI